MATVAEDSQKAPDDDGPELVSFWKDELGRYEREFKAWTDRSKKIIRRYRDERPNAEGTSTGMSGTGVVRYDILWSNVQTLGPAIYSRAPEPVVERRFLDKDPMARIGSMILERATKTQLEVGGFHPGMERVRLDYLLPGRGQMWVRYEPEYGDAETTVTKTGADVPAGEEPQDRPQEVRWENVCVDYVNWDDFAHTATRIWADVWWVSRRVWLSREEGVKVFGPEFAKISLKKPGERDALEPNRQDSRAAQVEVWEIWDKHNREVTFIAPDWPAKALKREPDPLRLKGFWPCPPPLYATTTNDTLVPVPDFALYQDQAEQIDSLTNRIAALSRVIKAIGVYDGQYMEVGRVLSDGVDNKMIALANWAAFAQAGGLEGSMDFMPIEMFSKVLLNLIEAREIAKRDLFEITGMSDIIRGQSSGAAKTATEQRIKGQFASMRLEDRRKNVGRFVRDVVAIVAEVVAEHFSPETLIQMTGILEVVMGELPDPQMPQQPPQMAMPGQPPAPQAPPPDPAMIQQMKQQQALQVVQQAIQLLKDDKLRTFRIDIETDSTIEADQVMEKESVVEFMGAMGQFMNGILPVIVQAPPLLKPLAESLLHAMRRFKMGRSVEAAFEQAMEQLEKQASQPAGADPAAEAKAQAEKVKAEAAQAKAQTDVQVAQVKAQVAISKMTTEQKLAEIKAGMDEQQMQMDARKMELEAALAELKADTARRVAMAKASEPARKAAA